jgi:hypothetical protein
VKNNCMAWFALLVICFALILSARIAQELSVYSRTTPGLIFFYSSAGEDCSDVAPGFWRVIFIAAIRSLRRCRMSLRSSIGGCHAYLRIFLRRLQQAIRNHPHSCGIRRGQDQVSEMRR